MCYDLKCCRERIQQPPSVSWCEMSGRIPAQSVQQQSGSLCKSHDSRSGHIFRKASSCLTCGFASVGSCGGPRRRKPTDGRTPVLPHLLGVAREDLLPDDLRGEEALRPVGHDVTAEERWPDGHVPLEFLRQLHRHGTNKQGVGHTVHSILIN